ncbi:MAG: hypothetical protein Q8O29_14780 [Polaromonas sp.]|uniref:hypothetical protein n=1 Tax=Polaromonas sp. TaxID=1869339 RepID=UPI002733E218|nr:hypothetical protein [Polaromonas sp.]MDP2819501.1 hypothetical protein [Polaromonas sp.]
MPDLQTPFALPQSIPQNVMLAVLNRCDETREFMIEMWRANPNLAKQGGAKVAMLLSRPMNTSGTQDEIAPNS